MDACHSPNTLLSIAHCQAFRILTWQTTIDGTSLSTSGDTYGNSAGRVLETVTTGTNWPKYSWYHRRKYKLSAPNQQVNRMYLFYYQINIKSLNIILLQLDSSVSFLKEINIRKHTWHHRLQKKFVVRLPKRCFWNILLILSLLLLIFRLFWSISYVFFISLNWD